MRLSVDKKDPGYSEYCMTHGVWLDGVDVSDKCITADEEKGYVLCYKLDDKGFPFVDREKGEVVTEKLYGDVVIKKKGPEENAV